MFYEMAENRIDVYKLNKSFFPSGIPELELQKAILEITPAPQSE